VLSFRKEVVVNPERNLFEVLEPAVAGQGVELVEVSLSGAGRRSILRIVIHSAAGISHGDCERVTRAVEQKLEDEPPVSGRYVLEVSSPGIARTLKSPREFDVFRGCRLRARVREPEPQEVRGFSAGTREGQLVAIRGDDGREEVLPWSSIAKVRLDPDGPPSAGFGGKGS
jgi:ribosome maturation factor RimP